MKDQTEIIKAHAKAFFIISMITDSLYNAVVAGNPIEYSDTTHEDGSQSFSLYIKQRPLGDVRGLR